MNTPINILLIPLARCNVCNTSVFTPVVNLRVVSPIVSGQSTASIAITPAYQCANCQAIFSEKDIVTMKPYKHASDRRLSKDSK